MADISLPEVRLRDKLSEGLRDMTVEDIQRAVPEIHLPRMTAGREARRARKDAQKAARHAERAVRQVQREVRQAVAQQADNAAKAVAHGRDNAAKAVAHQADSAAKAVEQSLPRRPGPNPLPFVLIAIVGGLAIGWLLATSPTTGPRISARLDEMRKRWDEWRGGGESDFGEDVEPQPQAFQDALRAPVQPERYSGNLPEAETGVGVGPGKLPEGMGTSDPSRVGADDQM